MAQPDQMENLASPASLAVDAVVVLGFFAYIFAVIAPHVPSTDHKMILLWGGLAASCLSGVFWLALQMFRVVLRAQREGRNR